MSRRPDEELPLARQKPVDEDVRRELEAHLALRTEELIAEGWEPEAARAEARRVFGDLPALTSECREITRRHRRATRRAETLDAFWQDLVVAARGLRKAPGFTAAAVLTLALGIGANTAIFSIVNGMLLRPLPYERPDRLVDVVERHERGWSSPSWANFLDLQAGTRALDGLASYGSGTGSLLGADEPLRVRMASVSRDFFAVMRVRPALGRLPVAADHALGATPVALVGHDFWRNHLNSTTDLASVRLRSSFTYQLIGVLPPGFGFPDGTDVWHPLELTSQSMSRTSHNWSVIGRMRPGVTPAAAQQDLDGIVRRIKETAGVDFDAVGMRVVRLQDLLTGPLRRPLYLLLGASGLLLLAACTNLASAMLARGTSRAPELAIRTALGAGRLRIVRQLFTESLLLAGLGCAAGLAVGATVVRLLVTIAPPSLTGLTASRLDPWVLAFSVTVSLVTAVMFGLLPSLRISDVDAGTTMRESGRGTGPRRQRLWSVLVAVEVALAVVLLVGSGLLLHSFAAVTSVDLGFQSEQRLTVTTDLPEQEYPEVSRAVAYHHRALEAMRAVPGVEFAGVTNVLPLGGAWPSGGLQVEGRPLLPVGYPITGYGIYRLASTGFFQAMGMPILQGRDFSESDAAGAPLVVIVNEALAAEGWPGTDPIGRRLRIGGMDTGGIEPWATVVGVVKNVPAEGVTAPARPTYYFDYRQLPYRTRYLTTVLRSSRPLGEMVAPVRTALRAVDAAVPAEFQTMEDRVASSVADRRFTAVVLGAFAAVAFLLAAVGIYGVVSYTVSQRTREIGIRLALGAEPAAVRRQVQRRAMIVVAVGLVLGVAGALLVSRLLRSLLFDVTATDPLSFAAAVILLAAAGWLASWLPARRSTRVDPMIAIRAE